MTRRAQPEAAIQRAVFAHIRARGAPRVFAFHPANGGYRRPVEAKILQSLGVTSGVPDVIAVKDGRCFALELKPEGGKLTEAQEHVRSSCAKRAQRRRTHTGSIRRCACSRAGGSYEGD